ncbi:MAG: glycosyltransferase [Candidatus Cloacimonetes bacterium]|nr:glycosyltransferase [Candidatus Cloacimonadota bacterium]
MRKSFLFVLRDLRYGGAERFIVNLANHLVESGHPCTIALVINKGELLAELNKDIVVVSADVPKMSRFISPLSAIIQRTNPDILFSTTEYINIMCWVAWMFSRIPSTKLILREATLLGQHLRSKEPLLKRTLLRLLSRMAYNGANAVIFPSHAAKTLSCGWLGLAGGHHFTLYNPVDLTKINALAAESSDLVPRQPYFLAVGRIEREKNFDLLIRAFHIYSQSVPDVELVVLGNGSRMSDIKQMIQDLSLENRVKLPGFSPNPYLFMKHCVALVSCSEYEGLSNVLLEAVALNTKIIVTENCSSSVELTGHFGDGIVCKNSDVSLASALKQAQNTTVPSYKAKVATVSDYANSVLNLCEI